ncbi:SPOR domain-containing protein [Solimonas variicoloris]|uniref:SPOR domain-containing protein n=1 Tax=Solimonas variicoloris TaxID=254408 RepID=UPI00036C22A1|nr:SPOR domain-containing protein [Solimonas variicoloris]
MDDKLKRRLAGAAVLLLVAFVIVSVLPTPEQAAQPGDTDVVTIALHEVVNPEPPPPSATATPATIAAAPADAGVATPAGEDGEGAAETVISGDDDAGADTGDAQKPLPAGPDETAKKVAPPAAPGTAPPAKAGGKPDAASAPKPSTEPKAVEPKATEPKAVEPKATEPKAVAKPAEPRPTPAAKPAVPDPAVAKPAAVGSWFVQVGGFADIGNARQVQARLQTLGQPSILSPTETSKGTLYRVRAGPYAGREPAQAALDKLAGNGYPDAKLIAP